ncbi:MAG: hypothetical protein M1824_000796 [Vezdaea acicularis]|nr:MAG: hypothetical protein M1824_000796 [Vezdaea acicularis]
MGLGVLSDSKMDHVPGTTRWIDESVTDHNVEGDRGLGNQNIKRDRTGSLILSPQPSDDPNDPLNWPLWKRDVILSIISLMSILATTLGPLLSPITITLALNFHTDFTRIALLTGYYLLGVGVGGVIFVASARVWGKRHLFLLGSILVILSSVWAGASKSYKSILWARIFQGIATAPFEALINAVVGDLYFTHERGKRLALTNLALFGGAFFTPVIVGKMTYSLGWRWPFYFVAIFAGLFFPLIVFFVPETAFVRSNYLNTDIASTEDLFRPTTSHPGSEQPGSAKGSVTPGETTSLDQRRPELENSHLTEKGRLALPQKASFAQSLKIFNGRKSNEPFFKLLVRPFPLFAHPAVLWGCLIQGCLIGWTVLTGVVLAIVFLSPPLFFNEVQTGYLYSAPFIGAILGFILSGAFSDWSCKVLTRRNGGVYEPEFRIFLVVPQLIIGCAGLYGFGICSANPARYGWFPPDFFFGCIVMGMVIGAVASASYLVDAHREYFQRCQTSRRMLIHYIGEFAVEAFTCLLLFKNFFSFALTFKAYDWILHTGVKSTFIIIASIQVGVCLISLPMCKNNIYQFNTG